MSRKLVAYFSASGVTAGVARKLAQAADADLYEIRPKTPYTRADLNWQDENSRSSAEMRDSTSRPALADQSADIANYDVVFIGFPIWWYVAPTIVNTFLESYDFTGKTIILFATSGGSGFGGTTERLRGSVASGVKIREGALLNGSQTVDSLRDWLKTLAL